MILEPYVHTFRQGLADRSRTFSAVLPEALDVLWDYLEGKKVVSNFQDFSNNLYASTLDYNVEEEIIDVQAEFPRKICRYSLGKYLCMADVCMEYTDTPLLSNKASDVMKAQTHVYQTPLFRQFIEHIQNGLKDVVFAIPEQYSVLWENIATIRFFQ